MAQLTSLSLLQVADHVLSGGRPVVPPIAELPGAGSPQFAKFAASCLDAYVQLMQRCWAPTPADRPTMDVVATELRWAVHSLCWQLCGKAARSAAGLCMRCAPSWPSGARCLLCRSLLQQLARAQKAEAAKGPSTPSVPASAASCSVPTASGSSSSSRECSLCSAVADASQLRALQPCGHGLACSACRDAAAAAGACPVCKSALTGNSGSGVECR